ncbi:UDP-N-acetylglucosamine pyrophosphorylase [Apostasia shenzhenica]|uniref:UDP-N-acetylglucosamine pyrophosphorylase n=1 Tax=Apostasia shenzhenica TaxID=1088818 RepID=A0A2I0B088_9ASPA|nr:UDP-N-acetylglucosamine pyrophosphorylase [Apostasia shenzhenica]
MGMKVNLREFRSLLSHPGQNFNRGLVFLLSLLVTSETGMLVGTVANVFNSEIDASRQFVWIPFVEAIVPEIDTTKREMYITPPKGLLELNLRNDMRSKKQRRHEEWRQKKKLHQRLMAAKKKLHELGQSHVLDGFNFGEKDEKIQLATQIVDINFLLFQHALLSIERSSKRLSFYDFLEVNSASLSKKALRVPYQNLIDCAYPERIDELHNEGLQLLRSSKVAIVLVINGEKSLECLQQVLLNIKTFLKYGENHFEIPLIMIASTDQLQICEDLFSQNDYFGFNDQKKTRLWKLIVNQVPTSKLAIISRGSNKILLKSAWEILQAPVGSGGIFASISSQKCVDLLYEMGIEYVEVCCLRERCALGIPLFFGWASSCRANMALKIFDDKREDSDEEKDYDIIFSTEYLCQITKQPEALHFHAIPEQYEHVELVDGQWLQISPGPNSHQLHCSIYDALYSCSLKALRLRDRIIGVIRDSNATECGEELCKNKYGEVDKRTDQLGSVQAPEQFLPFVQDTSQLYER